jgi:hypothetical protein
VRELGDRRPAHRVRHKRKLVAVERVLQTLGKLMVDHDRAVPAGG